MADGQGYHVTTEGIAGAGGSLDLAADDVGAVRRTIDSPPMDTVANFGHYGAASGDGSWLENILPGFGRPFSAFSTAWMTEVANIEAALRELSKKVGTSSRDYGANEHATYESLSRVARSEENSSPEFRGGGR